MTIFADAGDAGRQAAATLADRLNLVDIENEVVMPLHGDDFNDDLRRGATAADYARPAERALSRRRLPPRRRARRPPVDALLEPRPRS